MSEKLQAHILVTGIIILTILMLFAGVAIADDDDTTPTAQSYSTVNSLKFNMETTSTYNPEWYGNFDILFDEDVYPGLIMVSDTYSATGSAQVWGIDPTLWGGGTTSVYVDDPIDGDGTIGDPIDLSTSVAGYGLSMTTNFIDVNTGDGIYIDGSDNVAVGWNDGAGHLMTFGSAELSYGGDVLYTWPDVSAGGYLTTDLSGNLSWSTTPMGSVNVSDGISGDGTVGDPLTAYLGSAVGLEFNGDGAISVVPGDIDITQLDGYLDPGTGLTGFEGNLNVSADYSVITSNDATTDVTGAQLETLTDGSSADSLHTHSASSVTPGGSDTQVQINDDGVLSGDAGLVYNKDTNALMVDGALNTTGQIGSSSNINVGENIIAGTFIQATTYLKATTYVRAGTSYFAKEQAAALADITYNGQIWVKDDTPNTLWFTNDAGTDARVVTSAYTGDIDITGSIGASDEIESNQDFRLVSDTVNTGGGWKLMLAEATVTTDSGTTSEVIQVDIPTNAKIDSVQIRVDTLVAGPITSTFDVAFSGGNTITIVEGIGIAQNSVANKIVDISTDGTAITVSEADITLTSLAGNFTAGVVRAVVYYWTFIPMDVL